MIIMVATFGKFKPFSGNKDNWEVYIERLEVFFVPNYLEEITAVSDNSDARIVKQCADKTKITEYYQRTILTRLFVTTDDSN